MSSSWTLLALSAPSRVFTVASFLLILNFACGLLTLTTPTTVTLPKVKTSICELKRQSDFKLDLISAMIFPDSLLLIDRALNVYKVARHDLEDSYGHIKFDNVPSVPIETYWPGLRGNPQWEAIKGHQKSISHVLDTHGHAFIYIDVLSQTVASVIYDPVRHKVLENTKTYSTSGNQEYIMDDGQVIYAISIDPTQAPLRTRFNRWTFGYDATGMRNQARGTFLSRPFYLVKEANPTEVNLTLIMDRRVDTPLSTLMDGLKKSPLYSGWRLEEVTTAWNVSLDHLPVGYVYKGDIYLFNYHRLLIFNASSIPSMSQINAAADGTIILNSKLTTVSYDDFFICASDGSKNGSARVTRPSTGDGKAIQVSLPSSSSSSTWTIVGASIGVLVALLGIAVTMYWCINKDGNKEKDSAGQASRKTSDRKKPSKMRKESKKLSEGASRGASRELVSKQTRSSMK